MARKKHEDVGAELAPESRVVSAGEQSSAPEQPDDDAALRPRSFEEFIGQKKIADNLAVYVQAARNRGDALDHVLLSGPPGLGKTTLAFLLAREMGTEVHVTSGPALERKSDLAGILTSLQRGDVLFIDEIHRLQPIVEESLYPAMEDFRIEFITGTGPGAGAITIPLKRFTLVGATTRSGQLGSPLLSRFGIVETFAFYSAEELTTIVRRSARLLEIPIDDAGAEEIGRRARGTPRIANRLLRRIRDFADVRGDGRVTRDVAEYALGRLEVDAAGLDAGDRRIPVDDRQTLRRRPRRHRFLGRLTGRGSRHVGVRLRALPDPGGLPDPHPARPPDHQARLRPPGAARTDPRSAGDAVLAGR